MTRRFLVLASLAFAGFATPALSGAAVSHTTGTIHIFVLPSGTGKPGPIVITGAIGDYGTAENINQNGTPDTTGSSNYALVRLQKGSFRVNLTTINNLSNKTNPTVDSTSCSAWQTTTGPVQLFDGAGTYARISGTLTLTESVAFIGPRLTSGKCNLSNSAQPVAFQIQITGAGSVSWG